MDVTTQLATKADATATTAQLATKANANDVVTQLATKADATTTTAQLANKADTATVNSQLANKANITYVDQKVIDGIALLVDSAPAALDTLKELAQALNNDSNYATTVQTQIAYKADKITTYTKNETTIC